MLKHQLGRLILVFGYYFLICIHNAIEFASFMKLDDYLYFCFVDDSLMNAGEAASQFI